MQKKCCSHKILVAWLVLGSGPLLVNAQDNFDPPSVAPAFTAVETFDPIHLDGRLIEPAWSAATPVKDFFKMEPRQGAKLLHETWVRVLFDKRNLYFGVFCRDSLGRKGTRVQDYRRDFVFGENDVFYLQLDPQNLRRYCTSFQTTPLGTQRDLQSFDDTFTDNDWDALWRVKTHLTDSGYYAEFAIPFKSLRYNKEKPDAVSWGVTFARLARRDYEQSVYPPVPQAYSPYRMAYAAQMKGLKLPPPSANIRIQPYGLYQFSRVRLDDGTQLRDHEWKAGGEIKWAVNTNSVLDITFNTDFAQADVDRAVNNLTRFNVFFPERRQFFLENSGVYAGADFTNIKPFFSRSIGLANTQFNAGPVPIDAGLRYTTRSQQETVAGLYVHQRQTPAQGAANFGVLRYLRNYGKQNNVGIMVTHRLDERDSEKGFRENNNTTLTIDGLIRPNNSWTIQYLASTSRNNASDSIGYGGSFYAGYFPNKGYAYFWTDIISEKYVPGMGYTFATNTARHSTGAYYIWRPEKAKLIRRIDPGVFMDYYQNTNDLSFQQASIYIFPVYVLFTDGSYLEYAITPTWQRINTDFAILGLPIARGDYYYTRQAVRFKTDQSKKYALNGSYTFGKYYNGDLQTTTAGIRVAPIPNIALTLDYEYNRFMKVGEGNEDLETSLITGGMRLALNPNLLGSVFYQYNSFDQQGRWNVRASWQFAPLSFIYVVFNDASFQDSPFQNQSLITKVTYLRQF